MPPNCPPRNARKRKATEDLRPLGRNPKGNATEGEMLVDKPQPEGEAQELLRAAGGNSPGQKLHEDIPKDKPQTYAWDVSPLDPLLKPPECNYTYITARGTLRDPHRYDHAKRVQTKVPHPKLAGHIRNGTASPGLRLYYANMPHGQHLPLAGIGRERTDPEPFHNHSDAMIKNRLLTYDQEAEFHSRPSIKIPIPDHIKAILVDDWENVTKNQQLVPLPHPTPVNTILNAYHEFEAPKRQPGSAQADILDEFVAGLREYFNKSLGRILLYR